MNGYNFTERVRNVLALAREEAARLHHEYVGTEHMLLGIIREGEGVGVTALQNLNVDIASLRARLEAVIERGRSVSTPRPDLPYTSRAKRVLELTMQQASSLQHPYVGTEHLLLGLIAEEKGIAAQVLAHAGVTLEEARAEILRILGTEMPSAAALRRTSYEELGAVRGRDVERIEVVLHYRDGGQFRTSFTSAQDARGFFSWLGLR